MLIFQLEQKEISEKKMRASKKKRTGMLKRVSEKSTRCDKNELMKYKIWKATRTEKKKKKAHAMKK